MYYTFIPGSKEHMQGSNGTITRIVMHGTVSSCARGGARNVARYFKDDKAGGLAHFVVDPAEVIQCCKEDTACWHAPPNKGSLGVELCDWQSGPGSRWHDHDHTAMLQHAAGLVAVLCRRHNIPARKINAVDLNNGLWGICGHDDVSEAFRQSDHTDPGADFPWPLFISMVHAAMRPPGHAVAKPAPHSATPSLLHIPSKPAAHGLLVLFHGDPKVWELVCPQSGPSSLVWVTAAQWVARGLKRADVRTLPVTDRLAHLRETTP